MNTSVLPVYDAQKVTLPMVELFQTVEGEGMRAGFLTTFVRVFHCNLRCTWCDTKYSYAPFEAPYVASISEIVEQVTYLGNRYVCLTGGEPLIHREKSLALVHALAQMEQLQDVHIETNGAIDLTPYAQLCEEDASACAKVRFIMDYKLGKSGETQRMHLPNFKLLRPQDEIKFVIADEVDFDEARMVLKNHHRKGQVLFSPVWETMPPAHLVELMLSHHLVDVKFNLQQHKVIWHPDTRGV